VLLEDGFAVSVRSAPPATESTHAGGQLSRPSLEAITPCPVPVTATVTCSLGAKFTLTVFEASMVREQLLSVPLQSPPHAVK